MNPYALLAAVLFWAGSVGAAGWFCYGAGVDSELAGQAREDKVRQATIEASQQGAAQAIAANRPMNTTIVQKATHEIQTNTVYRDCKLPPAGLQLANQALTGRTEPAGGSVVPAPDGAKR